LILSQILSHQLFGAHSSYNSDSPTSSKTN
jgi:hypothetical protein